MNLQYKKHNFLKLTLVWIVFNLKKDTFWIMCLAEILDLHKPQQFRKTKSVEVVDLLLKKGLVIG